MMLIKPPMLVVDDGPAMCNMLTEVQTAEHREIARMQSIGIAHLHHFSALSE
jgi:hypothetical protein